MPADGVTLYIATSVDGFVADADGGVEWLEQFDGDAEGADTDDSGTAAAYEEFFASVDALVMGATTYEQVCSFGDWPYADTPTYVLAHRERERASDTVEFVAGDEVAVVDRLTRLHDHIWLVGGAAVAQSFLRHGLIDTLRVTVVPVVLGSGIPLFESDPAVEAERVDLVANRSLGGGVVELHYRFTG